MELKSVAEPRPEIFRYLDYRQYLHDMYWYLKTQDRAFSFQYVSRRLGVTSSYLKNVVEKRRHISLDKVTELAQVLQISESELDFFSVLVVLGITKDPKLQGRLSTALASLTAVMQQVPGSYREPLDPGGAFVTESWLAGTIYEMARHPRFRTDPEWIQKHLVDGDQVPLSEISDVVRRLLELGIIVRNGDGSGRVGRDIHQYASPFSAAESLKIYKGAVRKTDQILNDAPRYRPCRFFVGTLSVGPRETEEILREFDRYKEAVTEIAQGCTNPDRVLFFSNNCFRVANAEVAESN